ncbi:MAG: class I SAM-dependent methyltransferase [Bacteroidota bacterium]
MNVVHHTQCPLCNSRQIHPFLVAKDHSISQEDFELWSCQNCSFTFTQDAPAPAEIGPYYKSENYISHSDTKAGLVNRLYHMARDYMLGRKFNLLQRVSKGKKILDYGTGTGYFVDYLQRNNYDAEGIEIDDDARQYGSQKFGIKIHPPAFLTESTQEKSYDAISLWHVLEHLYEPYDYLKRFHEILKDDGVLLVAVPNFSSSDAQHYGPYWAAYDVPRHLWHFSPDTMEKMMANAGFQLSETHHMPMDPFYVSIMSAKYQSSGGLISGGMQGFKSFLKSSRDAKQGSSVIYVLRKQE